MKLDPADVRAVLKKAGITRLFHANTVRTSLTFINEGGLLSRGAVEDRGLVQTPQSSDQKDREVDVWFDIFFDAIDIHSHMNLLNEYGPVVFVYDADVLLWPELPPLWITKRNPIKWISGETPDLRYWQSVKEYEESEWGAKDADKMLTLRATRDPLPFESFLKSVIVDDVEHLQQENLHDPAVAALREAMDSAGLNSVKVKPRGCHKTCPCNRGYHGKLSDELAKRFNPAWV